MMSNVVCFEFYHHLHQEFVMPTLKELSPGTLIRLPNVECVYRVKEPFADFGIKVDIPGTEHFFIWGRNTIVELDHSRSEP